MGSAWNKRGPANPDDAEDARQLLQRIVLAYDLCDLLDPNAGALSELEQAMEAARSHLLRQSRNANAPEVKGN